MKTWIKPSAIEENFASNQNIANSVNACYSLYCKVAGDGKVLRETFEYAY